MKHLALGGGTPVRVDPFPNWPVYGKEEEEALSRVLRSGQWGTLGPEASAFEKEFAEYLGTSGALCVANGTVSLETALRALDIGPGDEVIIPAYTFIATLTSVLITGALPVFSDIDPKTNTLDPEGVRQIITHRTKAVILVHMAGIPADMDAFAAIASKHGILIIEDAAQAHGSEWKRKKAGTLGSCGSFSFQATKNMSAGEGGAIVSARRDLLEQCWSIHHTGRSREGAWYEHVRLGTNYRITDWQAAVLRCQLSRLDEQIRTREGNAEKLIYLLKDIEGIDPLVPDHRVTRNTWHLFMFRYDAAAFSGVPKGRFVRALEAEGIPAFSGYTPLYSQAMLGHSSVLRAVPDLAGKSFRKLPATEKACRETVWFPQYLLLGTDKGIEDIASAVEKIQRHSGELAAVEDSV